MHGPSVRILHQNYFEVKLSIQSSFSNNVGYKQDDRNQFLSINHFQHSGKWNLMSTAIEQKEAYSVLLNKYQERYPTATRDVRKTFNSLQTNFGSSTKSGTGEEDDYDHTSNTDMTDFSVNILLRGHSGSSVYIMTSEYCKWMDRFKPYLQGAYPPIFPRRIRFAMPFTRFSAWKTRRITSLKSCACQLFSEENSARKTCRGKSFTSPNLEINRRWKLDEEAPRE